MRGHNLLSRIRRRLEPVGILREDEFLVDTIFSPGKIMAFRSPLVCQSEVKSAMCIKVKPEYEKYFLQFKNQNVAMINGYDLIS